jgi:hypothetical protein
MNDLSNLSDDELARELAARGITSPLRTKNLSNLSDDELDRELRARGITSPLRRNKDVSKRVEPQTPNAAPGYLIIFGVILAVASGIAYLWGANYAGNFGNAMSAGFGSLVGRRDQTYDMAIMAVQFGPFGFFTGLILFVGGLVLKNR